jgi:hypothetical protein
MAEHVLEVTGPRKLGPSRMSESMQQKKLWLKCYSLLLHDPLFAQELRMIRATMSPYRPIASKKTSDMMNRKFIFGASPTKRRFIA